MKKTAIIITSILAMIAMNDIHALDLKAKLSHYSTKDGLASNAISDITTDKYGYIWLATYNGLCRYDGYSFYNYSTGLRSNIPEFHNRILKIHTDTEGNIWMRMYDNRVFVLDRNTDKITSAFQGINGGSNFITTHEITVAPNGDVYVIVDNKGIYRIRLANSKFTRRNYPLGKIYVNKVVCDDQGNVWLATNNGMMLLDNETGQISYRCFAGEDITAATYRGNSLYAGTMSGKILYIDNKGQNKLIKQLNEKHVSSIYADSEGQLWFSTEKQGVSRLKTTTGDIKDFTQIVTIPDIDLNGGMFSEADGILWVRMNHGGFGYYDRQADEIKYFHNNPDNPWNLSNTLTAYLPMPHGVIWMSTIRRGLEKLELFSNHISRYKLEPDATSYDANEIRAILQDRKSGKLFIGSKAGKLYIFDKGKRTVTDKNSEGGNIGRIYNLMQDRKGNIWMSTKGNGLYRMTADGNGGYIMKHFRHNETDRQSISSDNVYCTVEDKDGNIWIATFGGGINMLPGGNDRYGFINANNTVSDIRNSLFRRIRTLAVDNSGLVWAGTSDGIILFSYNTKTKKICSTRLKQTKNYDGNLGPLESYDIIQIAKAKDGRMWIATNSGGLSRAVQKDKDGGWMFETYSDKNGLPSSEIKSITFDNNGTVWFTTDQTICSFYPEKQQFAIFSSLDGIGDVSCSECAATQLNNGKLFFGTLDGYYLIDRNNFSMPKNEELKLKITNFYINNEIVSPRLNDFYDYYIPDSNYVRLPSRSSAFAFSFASLSHHLQHRVHYQYMLEGYDDEWHNADAMRMASFYDIPAGTYKFKVKAFLLESPDKYEIAEITVKVPPYFWASTVALWIYIILIVLGCVIYFWVRKKRKIDLENMKVIKVGPQDIAFKHDDDYEFVKQLLDWLEEHYTDANIKIENMLENSSLSRTSFYNKVKSLTGLSPKELISDFRFKKAIMYLENTNTTIQEIAYKTGFNDPVYFTRTFKLKMGITPTKYREEAKSKNAAETNRSAAEATANEPE